MKEQKFCAKCGRLNWSQWGGTCECREPDFRFDTYDDYLFYHVNKPVKIEIQTVNINEWLMDMGLNEKGHSEISFKHEGKQFVLQVTEKDARSLHHLFQMARMAGDIK